MSRFYPHLRRSCERTSRNLVAIHSVEEGWQRLTEYDVTDANCLTEWAHAQLVGVLKTYLRERDIDDEIDFKIVRGQRQGLTSSETANPEGKRASVTGWFKKTKERSLAQTA